jgi:hypothetical protein
MGSDQTMRRFLIWSALALVIGLFLAGGAYWAYWNFHARFQPVTISRNQAEIQRLLDEASWVSGGGGGAPLYIVTYRDSAAAQRYEREETDKLRAAGVETRIIVFARPDREGLVRSTAAERATVAEIWLSRDWTLYQRWTATPSANWTAVGIPAADGNRARSAVVDASRDFTTELENLLRGSGVSIAYPLILWRDHEGFLKACACSDARSWAFIRDDLNAPDAAAPADLGPEPDVPGAPLPQVYPDLPAIPPVTTPGAVRAAPQAGSPTAPAASAPAAQPRRTAPAPAPATREPRAAPTAQQQDDTTFF